MGQFPRIPKPRPNKFSLRSFARKLKSFYRKFINLLGYGLLLFFAVSIVYTFIKLPDEIILSTDIKNPEAVAVSTWIYLLVLILITFPFMYPLVFRRGYITTAALAGTGLLLLFHCLFVAANITG
jgi:hypothetical protein